MRVARLWGSWCSWVAEGSGRLPLPVEVLECSDTEERASSPEEVLVGAASVDMDIGWAVEVSPGGADSHQQHSFG